MKAGLKIGERGSLRDFEDTYTEFYLHFHGLDSGTGYGNFIATKNGSVSLDGKSNYMVTYLGDKLWDIRKD